MRTMLAAAIGLSAGFGSHAPALATEMNAEFEGGSGSPGEEPAGGDSNDSFSLGYYSILYGPSIGEPTSFQPRPDGTANRELPVFTKNFLTLGYAFDEALAVSGTAYWQYQPVRGHALRAKDPYAKLSHDDIMRLGWAIWYGDVRAHFPVTLDSRETDLLAGVQTFHSLTFPVPDSRFSWVVDGSARVNIYGSQGMGDDLELYLGPTLIYQVSPDLALRLLYEMMASHPYGGEPLRLNNDGTDLQPGVSWDIRPNLNFGPYVNLYTGGQVTLASTSIGFTLSWVLL